MSKWTTEILHGQVQINARLDVRRNASQTKQFIPTLPGTDGNPPYPAGPQIGNFFEMVWHSWLPIWQKSCSIAVTFGNSATCSEFGVVITEGGGGSGEVG